MRWWSIYSVSSGLFTGDQVLASEHCARAQLRAEQEIFAGAWDKHQWRVEGGAVVPYLPLKPADDQWQTWALSEDGKRWIATPTVASHWRVVRIARDQLLASSDWTDTASAPLRLGAERYSAWQEYRQALRDVTLQPDPLAIIWPTKPE